MSKYHPQNYGPSDEMPLSQKQNESSPLRSLQGLAEDRGADIDLKSLLALARKLENWPADEIKEVCISLGQRERKEGEPAFPTLGILLDALRSKNTSSSHKAAASKNAEEIEQFYWDHIDYKISCGMNEQEAMDTITTPGYVGRRAYMKRPPRIRFCEDCGGMGMTRHIRSDVCFVRDCGRCHSTGRAA